MLLFLILKPIRTVVKDDQQIIKIEIRIITKTASTDSIRKIREKEDAKKAQKRQHTPYQEPHVIPQPQVQQKMAFQPSLPNQNHQNAFKSDREMQKEHLAKKMEEEQYNPFGKFGSGAPNMRFNNIDQRNREQEKRNSPSEQQLYPPSEQMRQNDMNFQNPVRVPQMQVQNQYQRITTPQFLQGAYNNTPFVSPQFAPAAPYGYVNVENRQINYVGKLNIPQQRDYFQPTYEAIQQGKIRQPEQFANYPINNEAYQPPREYQQPQSGRNSIEEMEKQIYKNGGRNLLKLENQIPQEIISKQNQKLRLQQQLRKQIEDAARRKKEEAEKMREQDERLDRKNRQFLELQKKKYEQELKGKKNQAQDISQANAQAKVESVNLKKQKFQRIRQDVEKRQNQQKQQRNQKLQPQFKKEDINQKLRQRERQKQNNLQRNNRRNMNDIDQVQSAISNQTQMDKGFNTAISKQFFRREREKSGSERGKLQKISEQMQKMRRQIAHQGNHYQKQIEKVQKQASKAKNEKERADQEIFRLRQQLKQKMDAHNKKFLNEIYSGKIEMKDPYYADNTRLVQQSNNILRPKQEQNFVLKQYRPQDYKEYYPQNQQILRNDSQIMSLIGDSKKIPLDIDSNQSLTISNIEGFAKDTSYFDAITKKVKNGQKYQAPQSIMEQDEMREDSRHSTRAKKRTQPHQQLDMLIESRKKSRGGWGELSSVNSDMVNEIDHMLKNNQRPKSHLAKVAQNSLLPQELQSGANKYKYNPMQKIKSNSVKDNQFSQGKLDQLIDKYI